MLRETREASGKGRFDSFVQEADPGVNPTNELAFKERPKELSKKPFLRCPPLFCLHHMEGKHQIH
jgi:hypothetical protein